MKECPLVMLFFLQLACSLFSDILPIACISFADTVVSGLVIRRDTMALVFIDDHIIYYHMGVQWPAGLAQICISSPDYLLSNVGSM